MFIGETSLKSRELEPLSLKTPEGLSRLLGERLNSTAEQQASSASTHMLWSFVVLAPGFWD